ncbi:hypothetical protein DPX16_22002 [Anabarilius grahami]|uniref:Uncharacterized protein n=1 Tax=Anabarilius grahami TaxID=495550 RepID=A0A3N0XQ68_ANAGA|nr:hypothetical protein DPX16_22002 [Anabarilius grahami]
MEKHKKTVKKSYRVNSPKMPGTVIWRNCHPFITDLCELTAVSWSAADPALLPKSSYLNIVRYLVYGINAHTSEQFKNYKSLEAPRHFICD